MNWITKNWPIGLFFLGWQSLDVNLAMATTMRFEQVVEGLTSEYTWQVMEDRKSNLWIGTMSGLNWYDGKHLVPMLQGKGFVAGLDDNLIRGLHQTRDGSIWVMTQKGANVLRPGATAFRAVPDSTPSGEAYRQIYEMDDGTLWLSSTRHLWHIRQEDLSVLAKIDSREMGEVLHFLPWHNKLLLFSLKGAFLWQHGETDFTPLMQPASQAYPAFNSVLALNSTQYLLGSLGEGLWLWSFEGQPQAPVRLISGLPELDQAAIFGLAQDRNGLLWIGAQGGLFKAGLQGGQLDAAQAITMLLPQGEARNISDLQLNTQDELLLATEQGVLIASVHQLALHSLAEPLLGKASVSALAQWQDVMWVGTHDSGVLVLDKQEQQVGHYQVGDRQFSLPSNRVQDMYLDQHGMLWIATDKGLSSLNVHSGEWVTAYPLEAHVKCRNYKRSGILSIAQDRDRNRMLFAGTGLLHVLDRTTGQFSTIQSQGDNTPIPCGQMVDVEVGHDGRYYLLAINRGVALEADFTHSEAFWLDNTLPNAAVAFVSFSRRLDNAWWLQGGRGTLALETGNLQLQEVFPSLLQDRMTVSGISDVSGTWLGSTAGLVHIDTTSTPRPRIYSRADGLTTDKFNLHAAYQLEDGRLAFGSERGLLAFKPDNLAAQEPEPQLGVSYMAARRDGQANQVMLHFADPGRHAALLLEADTAGLEFWLSGGAQRYKADYQYQYRLAGYQAEWVTLPRQSNRINLSYLPSGNYQLFARLVSPTGMHSSDQQLLEFRVLPHWYQRWYAWLLFSIIMLFILWLVVKYRTASMQRRNQLLQQQVAEQTANLSKQNRQIELQRQSLAQALSYKEELLANIAHELKTPLTLMLGVIGGESLSAYRPLKKLIHRVSLLLDRMLDLSSGLNQAQKTQPQHCYRCEEFIEFYFHTFAALLPTGRLNLADNAPALVRIEQDGLDKIITNLLSNAIKYSSSGSSIEVRAKIDSGHWQFSVKNQGPGLDTQQLDSLFQRFIRANERQQSCGLGLGLPLVKHLVEAANGQLQVQSSLQGPTCVLVSLPVVVGDATGLPALGVEQDEPVSRYRNWFFAELEAEPPEPKNVGTALQTDHDVLVYCVDDNPQLLQQLSQQLGQHFHLCCFDDAHQAIEQAKIAIPDVILSDLMMPGMNGLELIEQIRADELLSHIPVILLTARSDAQSRKEGLARLADDYLCKPYDPALLAARIDNLIGIRRLLKASFSLSSVPPTDKTVKILLKGCAPGQHQYMQKVIQLVKDNLGEEEFGVKQLSELLCLSESQVRRKIKAISGYSPLEVIRIIRLEAVAQMIRQGLSLKAITQDCGFASQSHMGACFKAYFGLTPNQYRQNAGQ